MNYSTILRHSFQVFSIKSAARTALPTLKYYLGHKALPKSDKPALFTMNILPPMMTVWYHFARKNLGDNVDITIFDCSGKLKAEDFPNARVQKFLNMYAATKSNEFIRKIAKNRKMGWVCDDDIFFTGTKTIDALYDQMHVEKTASVSFRPRSWWHFEIDGKEYEPSGSYCLVVNRDIFVEKEHLSFAPADGNTHPSHIGKVPGRYDTFDKANEILLQKNYRCAIVPKDIREECITGFSGMSGGVMLLNYFKKPEQVMDYFLSPPKEQWTGNVLFGTLSAMLAICTIQKLHEKLTGKPYPLPSLPDRSVLEKIRKDHTPFLREGQSFAWIDEVSEKLRAAL